ncbi:single-stranded DNA-binding protein [Deminuibacter soli]|uniref:Single-stranded DNA-binding protein n=1 Tax=Deminuibacter soli TaxID=2291815 RepID=A0A3E1NQQ5_9BACT|nr:single-stranded DNA-binding protein [Deminuibacter soli]RFM30262.1 single-stranded DNA-binding protein [Deminuibacter soli]
MNNIRNKVQLIGNLGNNPEVTAFGEGKKRVKFHIATHEYYRNNKGEKVVETYWHTVVAWGKTGEIAEKHFSKGSEVVIEGKLISRSFKGRDGINRTVTEIQALDLMMLAKKAS